MTTVFPISATGPAPATTAPGDSATDASAKNQLDQDTFLALLVAQLKYQDPMHPADSTQFLTQTAQFTVVETLQRMEKSQAIAQGASQVLAASTMIGRPATYSLSANGSAGTPTATSVISVRGSLPTDATVGTRTTVTTSVFTTQGSKIPLDLDFTRAANGWKVQASTNGTKLGTALPVAFDSTGDHANNDLTIPASALDGVIGTAGSWPASGIRLGFGSAGDPGRLQLASGPATITVAEQDGNDGQSATGIVTSVHLTSDGPQLVIGGRQIPYTSITDVQS